MVPFAPRTVNAEQKQSEAAQRRRQREKKAASKQNGKEEKKEAAAATGVVTLWDEEKEAALAELKEGEAKEEPGTPAASDDEEEEEKEHEDHAHHEDEGPLPGFESVEMQHVGANGDEGKDADGDSSMGDKGSDKQMHRLVIDNFTSTLDRDVGLRVADGVAAYLRKHFCAPNKAASEPARSSVQVVLASPHSDVIARLRPDFVFSTADNTLALIPAKDADAPLPDSSSHQSATSLAAVWSPTGGTPDEDEAVSRFVVCWHLL